MIGQAIIVRHGNTFLPGEPARRIGARTDPPLVPSGRAQALALRDRFVRDRASFARILCSPLLRTRETAALIAPDIAIEATDWLREIDHGPDEDATEDAVIARIGAAALAAWETDAIAPHGWAVDATSRLAAWRALFATPPEHNILLVTSNGAARFARLALGMAPAKLRTGSFGVIDWRDGAAKLVSWDVRP